MKFTTTFQAIFSRFQTETIITIAAFAGEDGNLLRATRLVAVLRRGARILRNSSGSASTYMLSEKTSEIDYFISHNWSVSRLQKFLALAIHFNLGVATSVALLAAILTFGIGTIYAVQAVCSLPRKAPRVGLSLLAVASLVSKARWLPGNLALTIDRNPAVPLLEWSDAAALILFFPMYAAV